MRKPGFFGSARLNINLRHRDRYEAAFSERARSSWPASAASLPSVASTEGVVRREEEDELEGTAAVSPDDEPPE
jgi:hypothetical protein